MLHGVLAIVLVATAATPGQPQRHRLPRDRDVVHHIVILGRAEPATPKAASAPAQAAPAGETAPVSTASGAATPGQPGATPSERREQAQQAENAQLVAQTKRLDGDVAQLQALLESERRRTAALERDMEAERARWQLQAEQPIRRTQVLTTESYGLASIDQALAAGSSDVGPAIAQAQARIAAVASNAGAGGSEAEATASATAAQLLAASQEAMQRSDLYQARQALDAAALEAQRARSLAAATAYQSY